MKQITIVKGGRKVPCGRLIYEDGALIWERRVTERRHLFRWGRASDGSEVRDAWTIGEYVLSQLRELGVERIRYICGSDIYEVSMRGFLRMARELDQSQWSQGTEPQWGLPRSQWRREKRESAQKQLALQI